jgi:chemotaxis protein methyltransferase CheR
MSAITETDFLYLAREVQSRTGLALSPDKAHAIEARIAPIARREGLLSVQELITTARARRDERLLDAIADSLASFETHFFRDRAPFEAFRRTMSLELAGRRAGTPLRIWCAGCSTGQEPYSLAMALEEMKVEGRALSCEIVATDVSPAILEKARNGLYSQFEVQRGLPINLLIRHFEKAGDLWRISDRIRAKVKLIQHNLLEDSEQLGVFDIIFCRNVISGLQRNLAAAVLDRISNQLADDGYLVLGANETPAYADAAFAPTGKSSGVFTRAAATQRAA